MRQLKISKQITNREAQSLDKYLQEIGRVDLITAEVEVELAKRIKEGDQMALEKLTKANLRFVVSVAKQSSPAFFREQQSRTLITIPADYELKAINRNIYPVDGMGKYHSTGSINRH